MNSSDRFKELCEQAYGKRKSRYKGDEDYRDDFDDSDYTDDKEEYD